MDGEHRKHLLSACSMLGTYTDLVNCLVREASLSPGWPGSPAMPFPQSSLPVLFMKEVLQLALW